MILLLRGYEWTLDAALSFDYGADTETTDHPVERTQDTNEVTDQLDNKPLVFEISGIMSEIPLTGNLLQTVANLFSTDDKSGKQWAFVDNVLEARKNRELVSLDAGPRGFFENLVITSFNPTWTTATGESVQFSMSLKQIEFVETQTVFVLPERSASERSTAQRFAEPTRTKTSTTAATDGQTSLVGDALSFDGVSSGVDFVKGR